VTKQHTSDDGAARAQAPGCQRSSCGSVRRGRGGDRYIQRYVPNFSFKNPVWIVPDACIFAPESDLQISPQTFIPSRTLLQRIALLGGWGPISMPCRFPLLFIFYFFVVSLFIVVILSARHRFKTPRSIQFFFPTGPINEQFDSVGLSSFDFFFDFHSFFCIFVSIGCTFVPARIRNRSKTPRQTLVRLR